MKTFKDFKLKVNKLSAEIFVIIGLLLIILTTFIINTIIAMYLTAIFLICIGLFIGRGRK